MGNGNFWRGGKLFFLGLFWGNLSPFPFLGAFFFFFPPSAELRVNSIKKKIKKYQKILGGGGPPPPQFPRDLERRQPQTNIKKGKKREILINNIKKIKKKPPVGRGGFSLQFNKGD